MKTIDIYTTPQCGFCKQLKTLLTQEGISYAEHDVTSSDALLAEMQVLSSGALSVPVVVVAKGKAQQAVAIGFEEAKKLLGFGKAGKSQSAAGSGSARLTCPRCGHMQEAPIPTTSCVPFYICEGCKETIKASGEDCCVFCSYADRPCPLKSSGKDKGCAGDSCSIRSAHHT